MKKWEKRTNDLCLNGEVIFQNAESVSGVEQDEYNGCFITFKTETKAEENIYFLGNVTEVDRFMACHRECAFFMHERCGDDLSKLNKETLCLLIKRKNGRYVLLLPVFDECSSGNLQYGEKGIEVVAVTGSEDILTNTAAVLYITEGENPYEIMNNAAVSLKNRLKTFKLRDEKSRPEMLKKLGWCTWNAFYFDVNEKDLLSGIREFKDNGVDLGYALIDDGWLSTTDTMPIGSRVITSFSENKEKFPSGFKGLAEKAKNEFGVSDIMVWHASMGYWAGCGMEGLGIKQGIPMKYSSALQGGADSMNRQFMHHPVTPERAYDFYNGFHSHLKDNGISGVKIDVQYVIEGVSSAAGGRIKSMDTYHKALEESVHKNFNDNCLNCMSCSVDMLYRMNHTNMLRASDDYSPEYENSFSIICHCAYNTYWMYPIAFADWDMFWSNNKNAFINAVARIAGGSPIYVSDKLNDHNYDLLKLLYVGKGRVLRPEEPGRPTLDCLMYHPINDKKILKVFNKNKTAYIIGAMNFVNEELTCTISPSDIDGAENTEYIVFGFNDKNITKLSKNDKISINMAEKSADLYTVSPLINGAAVIGLDGKINASAAVEEFNFENGCIKAEVIADGEYRFWCESGVDSVIINGKQIPFERKENIIKIKI